MIDLERNDNVYILTMDAGENRCNTTFVRLFDNALDEVLRCEDPVALLTRSSHPKFFSNGLDVEWFIGDDPEHPGGNREIFGSEVMALFGRIITLPIPTVACVNGHAFGAGFMIALCHDVRFARSDRGYMCANEMELGMAIPPPELALFRHKMSAGAFFETVQLARRWTGPHALQCGIVQHLSDIDKLLEEALSHAAALAPLSKNRDLYGQQKEAIFGENSILHQPHGAAHLLRNAEIYMSEDTAITASHR